MDMDKDTSSQTTSSDTCSCCETGDARRGFFSKVAALVLGGVAFATPLAIGIVSFLNPLRLKSQSGRFFRLATLEVLPEDGTPRKYPVIADRNDAWNRFPNEPIGAVFLRRTGDKKKPIEALNVICPHAGCFIGFDSKDRQFLCPCHNAHFSLEGERLDENSESPRDMDTLEVEIRDGGEIWVKFENFRTGTPEKIVEA